MQVCSIFGNGEISQEWGKRLQVLWFGHCEKEWATTHAGIRQRIKKTCFPLSLQLPVGTFGLSCYYPRTMNYVENGDWNS